MRYGRHCGAGCMISDPVYAGLKSSNLLRWKTTNYASSAVQTMLPHPTLFVWQWTQRHFEIVVLFKIVGWHWGALSHPHSATSGSLEVFPLKEKQCHHPLIIQQYLIRINFHHQLLRNDNNNKRYSIRIVIVGEVYTYASIVCNICKQWTTMKQQTIKIINKWN